MSFITNSSPYGSNNMGIPQQQNKPQSGFGKAASFLSPAYAIGSSQGQQGGLWQSLFGKPEQNYRQSLLGDEQQTGYKNLLAASQGAGAGGAFGQSADYYRDLLDPNSQTAQMMFDPEQRRFREQIIPDLAEQFAGMGSGGLSSSGFRNASVSAGADLSERLGAIRAQLRQQGAQGLSNIGQMGLGTFNENIHRPETFGLLGNFAEGAGKALGSYATGKVF